MATIKVNFGEGGANLVPQGTGGEPTLAGALRDIADDLALVVAPATAPAALTSPTAGAGSGADATTFNGAECDALRADVAAIHAILTAIGGGTPKTIKG